MIRQSAVTQSWSNKYFYFCYFKYAVLQTLLLKWPFQCDGVRSYRSIATFRPVKDLNTALRWSDSILVQPDGESTKPAHKIWSHTVVVPTNSQPLAPTSSFSLCAPSFSVFFPFQRNCVAHWERVKKEGGGTKEGEAREAECWVQVSSFSSATPQSTEKWAFKSWKGPSGHPLLEWVTPPIPPPRSPSLSLCPYRYFLIVGDDSSAAFWVAQWRAL